MALTLEQRRAKARPLPPIATAIREAMRLARDKADQLDGAFIKSADARAVQGGAVCEEAQELRQLVLTLAKLTMDAEELEENVR